MELFFLERGGRAVKHNCQVISLLKGRFCNRGFVVTDGECRFMSTRVCPEGAGLCDALVTATTAVLRGWAVWSSLSYMKTTLMITLM